MTEWEQLTFLMQAIDTYTKSIYDIYQNCKFIYIASDDEGSTSYYEINIYYTKETEGGCYIEAKIYKELSLSELMEKMQQYLIESFNDQTLMLACRKAMMGTIREQLSKVDIQLFVKKV